MRRSALAVALLLLRQSVPLQQLAPQAHARAALHDDQYCVRLKRPLVRHRGIADLQILAQLVGQLRSVVEGCGTRAEEAARTDDRDDSR